MPLHDEALTEIIIGAAIGLKAGLLLSFNVKLLRDGIMRRVL